MSKGGERLPLAVRSKFGWIIFGSVGLFCNNASLVQSSIEVNCTDLISRFWELKDISTLKSNLSKEDLKCESHFQNTHSRDEKGRYIVRLPFQESETHLGESRQRAFHKFQNFKKRFSKSEYLSQKYKNP